MTKMTVYVAAAQVAANDSFAGGFGAAVGDMLYFSDYATWTNGLENAHWYPTRQDAVEVCVGDAWGPHRIGFASGCDRWRIIELQIDQRSTELWPDEVESVLHHDIQKRLTPQQVDLISRKGLRF